MLTERVKEKKLKIRNPYAPYELFNNIGLPTYFPLE